MALIKPATPFDTIKRKFSKSDEIYFRNRKVDNATISVRVKNPYDGGKSPAQVTNRNKFKQATTATDAALADSNQKKTYLTAFKKQKKYITLRGYIFAKEFAKL